LKRAIRYAEHNPVKAFLPKAACEWPWSSARDRDEYERLPWQRRAPDTFLTELEKRFVAPTCRAEMTCRVEVKRRRERRRKQRGGGSAESW
jgi:hypothetical protein